MSKKISELNETTTVESGAIIPVVSNGETKYISYENFKNQILDLSFPIGSRYVTQTNINPNAILGFGTWERLKGVVCVGLDENDPAFNSIGKTGGEKEHKLTIAEMPNHSHGLKFDQTAASGTNGVLTGVQNVYSSPNFIDSAGGSQPHNNLQPYRVVGYMWMRTH